MRFQTRVGIVRFRTYVNGFHRKDTNETTPEGNAPSKRTPPPSSAIGRNDIRLQQGKHFAQMKRNGGTDHTKAVSSNILHQRFSPAFS